MYSGIENPLPLVLFETDRPRANMVKELELDLSGIISQMSQMKPLLILLLIRNCLKVNKELKQERIIVLAKLEHFEIAF